MNYFHVKMIDRTNVEITSERGVVKMDLLTMEHTIEATHTKYNNLTKYFIRYGYGGWNYCHNVFNNCDGDVEIFQTIFYYIRYICSRGRYYGYNKSNMGNILKDYLNKRPDVEERKKVHLGIMDIIGSDLNVVIENNNFEVFKNMKFRKDIRRILVERQVKVDETFIKEYEQTPDLIIKIILMIENERMWNNFITSPKKDGTPQYSLYNLIRYSLVNLNQLINMKFDMVAIFRKIFNYYSVYENLRMNDALQYLKDYHVMLKEMKITNKEKYPRYLKSNHDIITSEHRDFVANVDPKKFEEMVRVDLEYIDRKTKMQIVAPRVPQDLKDEGEHMSHCVGSYIKRIVEGQTQVMFVRRSDDISKSLVTIEIREDTIIQAKAHGNKNPPPTVVDFLKGYAREKGLLMRC